MIVPAQGYFQQPVPQMPQYQQPIQQPQQSNIVVNVSSIEEAERYPIAPGSGVVIKISNSPFICCKSMGFSQFEQPTLKWYKLLEEEPIKKEQPQPQQTDISELQSQINELRELIEAKLANTSKPPVKKNAKEVDNV